MTAQMKSRKSTAEASVEKIRLHPRSPHRGRYDFGSLVACSPELAVFVAKNGYGDESIDFANPSAVKALNRALLRLEYGITGWDIPAQYLCPPIPGRADYLHYLADLLADGGDIPRGSSVRVFDVGVGANCIYPLIGERSYGWHFVGSDIDEVALANAKCIVDANDLGSDIELRLQTSCSAIFSGVMKPDESFDLTICNPPFHASPEEANAGVQRKWRNLGKREQGGKRPVLNFGGQGGELYCEGGEEAFIGRIVADSAEHAGHCLWYTTLVSKSASLPGVYRALKGVRAMNVQTIEMTQGQKKSRIVVWTFLDRQQQMEWRARWK
jgi:23S rRNA (adenine1618-N6)-methyltransferase